MAIDQEVATAPQASATADHPRDVQSILESLPVSPQEPERTQTLLDAIAQQSEDALAQKENKVFQDVLTAMLWVAAAAIAVALLLTLSAIFK